SEGAHGRDRGRRGNRRALESRGGAGERGRGDAPGLRARGAVQHLLRRPTTETCERGQARARCRLPRFARNDKPVTVSPLPPEEDLSKIEISDPASSAAGMKG